MRQANKRRLVERVIRLLARVEPPLLRLREEAQRRVDRLCSALHDPTEVERFISGWEARSEPKKGGEPSRMPSAAEWVKLLRSAKLGKYAQDPRKPDPRYEAARTGEPREESPHVRTYRAARWRHLGRSIRVTETTSEGLPVSDEARERTQAVIDELRRRAAQRPMDPKSARIWRDADLEVRRRLGLAEPPTKSKWERETKLRQYQMLVGWQKLALKLGRLPTRPELFQLLKAGDSDTMFGMEPNPQLDVQHYYRAVKRLALPMTKAHSGRKPGNATLANIR